MNDNKDRQNPNVEDFGTGGGRSQKPAEKKPAEQEPKQPSKEEKPETEPKQQPAPAQQKQQPQPEEPKPQAPQPAQQQKPAQQQPEQQPPEQQPPEQKPAQQPQPTQPAKQQPAQQPAKQQPQQQAPKGKRKLTKEEVMKRESKRNRKILFGCLGSFGCGTIILIILIFVFVGQAAQGGSALAEALGINQATLVNTLLLIVNFFFGLSALVAFILSIGGIFRSVMARKDDKAAKRRGYILSGASFGVLILIIMLWVGSWYYLNAQKVPEQTTVTTIQTTPESTLNLTAPVEITFDASNLAYDTRNYDIISYYWNFGDGNEGPGDALETHRYEQKGAGRFDVTLTITFQDVSTGEESTETLTKTVTIADEAVTAVIEPDIEEGPAPLTVTFDGNDSMDPDGSIESYAWEIDGGGFTEDDAVLTNTFQQVGEHTVRLRVTNEEGDFDIAETIINVTAGQTPVASIEILNPDDGRFYVDKSYTFDASASASPAGAITSYEWDFGDGTTKATTRTAQHSFSSPGAYIVVLTVTDEEGQADTEEMELEVELAPSAPQADIQTEPAKADEEDNFIEGTVPFEVNFDASGSTDPDDDIIDYKWDFDGDGEFDSAGETTAYVYNDPGTYTVTLLVIDSAGFEGKEVLLVKALSRGLEAEVTAEPVSGVVPLTVNFDATGSSYSDGEIVSYVWDFGDGSLPRSDVGQVTYKYTKIGNFNATVTVRTNDGKQEDAAILISVRQVPLEACFEPSRTTGDAPLTVTFNPQCSTGTIAKYRWSFGDGETSAERRPTHTFENPGSYEVSLEVSDAQNVVDASSEFITVTGELTQ
jgi:PKD repeat protein